MGHYGGRSQVRGRKQVIGFTVIGGYLGAGKTTLLNHFLAADHGIRIALLVNDFGEINIDAALIDSKTDSQINLTNGCICCSLTDGFVEAIDTLMIMQPKPQHIVVEASGVANVATLAQYGFAPGLRLDGILVLADAENVMAKANDKYVASTVRRQLESADLIILNKTDLLTETQLQERREWLVRTFPGPSILETSFGRVPISLLMDVHRNQTLPEPAQLEHENYSTWSFRSNAAVCPNDLELFVAALPADIIRAKGIALLTDGSHQLVQVVGPRKSLDPIESDDLTTQIVAIGLSRDFPADELRRLAEVFLESTKED